MAPPTPAPPGQRTRRNLDQPQWVGLTDDGTPRPVPELPDEDAPQAARDYWTALWSSPLSAMFLPIDHQGLWRLCVLHADAMSGDRTVLAEIRQLEDRFGTSPLARRRLQFEIEKGGGSAEGRQPVDEVAERRKDRKAAMKAKAS